LTRWHGARLDGTGQQSGMPHAVAIIPARLGSTRFPEKVLASATGRTLIQHVYERARLAACVQRVVVAADDPRIARAVEGFGGECVMTSARHPNGTSRLAEAAGLLGLAEDVIVVNVQGDEPELDPALIDAGVGALVETGAEAATVASPFAAHEDPENPNIVKAVVDARGLAMYFSRACIPYPGRAEADAAARPLKHVGLYVYRVGFLRRYVALAPTPLEQTEKLEQLRVLEHGYRMAVAIMESHHHGIDTPEQYAGFVERWKSTPH